MRQTYHYNAWNCHGLFRTMIFWLHMLPEYHTEIPSIIATRKSESIHYTEIFISSVTTTPWWLEALYDFSIKQEPTLAYFHFPDSNIQSSTAYGVFISWLIRYARTSSSRKLYGRYY